MNGPTEEEDEVMPARVFEVHHMVGDSEESSLVDVPEGAGVCPGDESFIVRDINDHWLCGFNNVTSFQRVELVEEGNENEDDVVEA